MHTPHLLYLSLYQWAFKLSPCLGYCKWCCSEHWGACILFFLGLLLGLGEKLQSIRGPCFFISDPSSPISTANVEHFQRGRYSCVASYWSLVSQQAAEGIESRALGTCNAAFSSPLCPYFFLIRFSLGLYLDSQSWSLGPSDRAEMMSLPLILWFSLTPQA